MGRVGGRSRWEESVGGMGGRSGWSGWEEWVESVGGSDGSSGWGGKVLKFNCAHSLEDVPMRY